MCLLAAYLAHDRHRQFPRLTPAQDLIDLSGLAPEVIGRFELDPEF